MQKLRLCALVDSRLAPFLPGQEAAARQVRAWFGPRAEARQNLPDLASEADRRVAVLEAPARCRAGAKRGWPGFFSPVGSAPRPALHWASVPGRDFAPGSGVRLRAVVLSWAVAGLC